MKNVLIISLLFFTISSFSQTLKVDQILDNIEKNERIVSSQSKSKQTIIISGGKKRTLEMVSYSLDINDKQLTIYTSYGRVKEDKIIILEAGNEIWFYTPKTDWVRLLARHAKKQKVQGSDFSHEDMTLWDSKMILWIDVSKYTMLPTDYYEDGNLIKRFFLHFLRLVRLDLPQRKVLQVLELHIASE